MFRERLQSGFGHLSVRSFQAERSIVYPTASTALQCSSCGFGPTKEFLRHSFKGGCSMYVNLCVEMAVVTLLPGKLTSGQLPWQSQHCHWRFGRSSNPSLDGGRTSMDNFHNV
ncbi:hypothetical protein PISMIDRAFT_683836 [Pisolithus microcarpus 441]|uniref:Uncharacterized protein n=1 Tax=Pisolithus microcarpus 441 TaxID=765257 RepID=A0A0C9Z8T2_9AGAM|nr:hypothetical protein PISMIDRAFT_683836 [Pisolithus microcarpus 441]